MLWWKHLECIQENIIMIEREEQKKEFAENATITLSLPTRDPVLRDNLLFGSLDQVKTLQASLFPICNKGTFISSFLQNNLKTNLLEISTDIKTFKTTAKLREPRELFALPKELDCPQQSPRWPSECQVVEERIHHITWNPASPEPYNVPTGKELKPQPVGEEAGTVIFQYYPMSAVNYFSRSSVGGSRLYLSACTTASGDDELRFESRFESGNLAKAIKITSAYYELHLRTDLYTNRHVQWFYFRVSNTKKHMTYRFSIVNFSKPESLYNEGMRPLLYSTKDAQLHSIGWRRCGENIVYYKNDPTCDEDEQIPSYTLTFNIEFPHTDDAVYISHCYPYTYSDLQEYLSRLQAHPVKSTFSKLRLLCRTLAGNNVYYLTITAPQNPNEMEQKVIVGNNRCSLTGKDLNRQYRTVIRETYPPVWHTKVMIRRLQEECGIAMFVDLHAHSRKHNIFIYGCESRRNSEKRLQEQVFPLMLHKNAADKFSFENCKFRIQRSKEGTARIVIWMLGVSNSYTMEASFGGSELGSRMSTHFSVQDYENLGKTFCETLLDFYDEDPSKERLRNKIVTRLLKEGSNADEPTNIDLSDYSSSSSEAVVLRCNRVVTQYAPPPSPIFPDINKGINENMRSQRPKLEKLSKMDRKKPKRQTLQVSRATIDLTSDAMTDLSSDCESTEENLSPVRRVHKLLRSSNKSKTRRKKKMPPELKILPAPTSDSPFNSDRERRSTDKCNRPRSVSMYNDTNERPKLKPASWHQRLPPPRYSTPTVHFLTKNFWTGLQDEERRPLSWGISSFAMNSYFTDSEALLRSCSKKLEELEDEKVKMKAGKKKKKTKPKKIPVPQKIITEDTLEATNKPIKNNKKKVKLKHSKSSMSQINNMSFTEIPKNTGPIIPKQSLVDSKPSKSFRKGAYVASAFTTSKSKQKEIKMVSENSDSDNSIQLRKKLKKKGKSAKNKAK
ncbi:unnamed protein product [Leptidea sinapis]|uniref:Peptidase M14 domain-containing protein n=1 Tax=Leptidea sinapis TaxID=189913 RepID=A0A5E4Q2C2_9NEOP|nr:unnamed protein product [Leptidea sinapis]